jgi:protein-arginine kinase activator protein McsA
MSSTKVCIRCHQEKPLEEFPLKSSLRGTRQTVCKRCTAERSHRWYLENKDTHIKNVWLNTKEYRHEASEYIWNYLRTHPCVDCGESDPVVLEFDHVRGKKIATVSSMIRSGFPLERIKQEIEKCEVRCSNCHRRKTAKDRGWFRWSR